MADMFLNPVGFVADFIAVMNAFGLRTPPQQAQADRISNMIAETQSSLAEIEKNVSQSRECLQRWIANASAIEVRSRLHDVKRIKEDKLENLIKLLLCLKNKQPVVFAVILRFKHMSTTATLSLAGNSAEAIEELVRKFDTFCGRREKVSGEISAYVSIRIPDRYDSDLENLSLALLARIAIHVCDLPHVVELSTTTGCNYDASGTKTEIVLSPGDRGIIAPRCDERKRIILIGDTGAGKSTIGNAMLTEPSFVTCQGATGSIRIQRGERREIVDGLECLCEIYDTPGLNDPHLDIFSEAAIKDQVRLLELASSLILVVAVDTRVTNSMYTSFKIYKDLFGKAIAPMLLVVLTLNTPADQERLDSCCEMNWIAVSEMDEGIERKQLFCVSLHDLREKDESSSHTVMKKIISSCYNMKLKIIESLRECYQRLLSEVRLQKVTVHREISGLIDDGRQKYKRLMDRFLAAESVKMITSKHQGFEMKSKDSPIPILGILMAGMTFLHVRTEGKRASDLWNKFVADCTQERENNQLMTMLFKAIADQRLAVRVTEMKRGTPWPVWPSPKERHEILIIDPEVLRHNKMSTFVLEKISACPENYGPSARENILKELCFYSNPFSHPEGRYA